MRILVFPERQLHYRPVFSRGWRPHGNLFLAPQALPSVGQRHDRNEHKLAITVRFKANARRAVEILNQCCGSAEMKRLEKISSSVCRRPMSAKEGKIVAWVTPSCCSSSTRRSACT